jgi:hypothetical protein
MQAERFVTIVFFVVLFPAFFSSCQDDPRNRTHANVSLESIQKGKTLAATYCASCHMLPDPSWLNAASWEKGVLPQMGPRLGIFLDATRFYPSYRGDRNLPQGFYPSKPILSQQEWKPIFDYYAATSPDTLPGQKRDQPIQPSLPLFAPQPATLSYGNAMTSFVKIAPQPLPYGLVISDVTRRKSYFFDKAANPIDSFETTGPVVDMLFSQNMIVACNIGQLNPNNGKYGKAERFELTAGKWDKAPVSLFDSLQRPVQLAAADFNGDGKEDYVVCEFGFLTGALSWMEGGANGQFTRHVLRPLPGSIKAYVNDWNGDGRPDFCVLMAQGDEGIFLYTNKGNGQFDETRLLRFPPIYGSSYFELADFNRDGHPDIVYTCGDNADYSAVLKPYHGVYIFMNDGANHFSQKYFFPINGCYKAMARDFDGDGDLDLATISFFADYTRQPEEGFVYLENEGNLKFKPFTVPEAKNGRWLTMDAGDVDGDGRIDLVLGNFYMGPNLRPSKVDWSKMPPYLFLKNTGKR